MKVSVHVIVRNESGQLLLVRQNHADRDWTPPGGCPENGESFPDTAVRECLEQTGYLIHVSEVTAVGSRPETNEVFVVLEGSILEKKEDFIESEKISEMGFFTAGSLPSPVKSNVKVLLDLCKAGVRGQIFVV